MTTKNSRKNKMSKWTYNKWKLENAYKSNKPVLVLAPGTHFLNKAKIRSYQPWNWDLHCVRLKLTFYKHTTLQADKLEYTYRPMLSLMNICIILFIAAIFKSKVNSGMNCPPLSNKKVYRQVLIQTCIAQVHAEMSNPYIVK